MIREDHFAERMTARWLTLGNHPSPALQSVWRQLCSTLNEQATCQDGKSRVVQPATGTGKSQGLALYASMHRDQPQFGLLIVVRLISQAEHMAHLINELARDTIARCRHTQSILPQEQMADTQVLVVTHRAYELSLEKFKRGDEERFSTFTAYNHNFTGQRDLVVIDEALDIVKKYQLTLEELSFALGIIPQEIRSNPEYTTALSALSQLKDQLETLERSKDVRSRLLPTDHDGTTTCRDLTKLRQELAKIHWDEHLLKCENGHHRNFLRERIEKTLEASQANLDQWHYYSKKGKHHTLNTATLVMPDNHIGAVILDATASQNLLYRLFQDKVLIKPVVQARTYANVTLRIARCRGVGKTGMVKAANTRTESLMADLTQRIPASSKVFLCSHKALEPLLASYDTPFSLQTGHWGAIDGRNDYQHCDTFLAFGLPYRDRIHSTSTLFAAIGPQTDAWLQDPEARQHLGYQDILRELGESQIIADTIQALNRIRIRRVVDQDGHCAPSTCFLILPRGKQGDRILEAITKAMPGIHTMHWDLDLDARNPKAKRKEGPPRSNFTEALCVFMRGSPPGRWPDKTIQHELNMPRERWKALVKQIKKTGSHLAKRMLELGCRVETVGKGRGGRTYLVKE